jgi:hypothetical protein
MRRTAVGVAGMLLVAVAARAAAHDGPDRFKDLPKGWTVKESVVVPDQQLPTFSQRLGGQVVRLTNTTLTVDGQPFKVNTIECKTDEDAAKVHAALLRIHKGNHVNCPRDGKTVVEFNYRDSRLIERAYRDLGFKPPTVAHVVSFRAAPVERCDFMQWNALFNAFLAPKPDESRIRQLAKSFTFGNQVRLRAHGLGAGKSAFAFTPVPRDTKPEADGEIAAYTFADLPQKYGIPELGVVATVTSEAFAVTPSRRKAGPELLAANEFWPCADADIVALAKRITEGKTAAADKAAAVLEWLMPGKNVKYAGVTGSRYGVKKVLQQGFGHCWDFSDCFVTLCRAVGVPCRQVLGWLHGVSGHVWAEVLIDGKGWRQVDPTTGTGCDCRYIPYVASEDGRMSLVYISTVDIKPKP